MEERVPWAKLARYLAGECSSEEEEEIKEWIEGSPSREELARQIRLIWDISGESETEKSEGQSDVDAEWEELQAEMGTPSCSASEQRSAQKNPELRRSERPSRRPVAFRFSPSAGLTLVAAAALIGIAGFLLDSTNLIQEQSLAKREVDTERGERATLRLSDGTKVKLNAESQLQFPDSFHGRDRRIVHLNGEAYFDVEDDSTKPFTVYANGASVDVHGTAFNVRAWSEKKEVQVAVEEGGVALQTQESDSTEKKEVRLESGEVGRVLGRSTLITTDQANLKNHVGWTNGLLVFEDTSLPKVATRLGRWYNLDFVIQDSSLRSMRLTANLKSESPTEVLNVIAASLGIRYQVNQGTVYLSSKETAHSG